MDGFEPGSSVVVMAATNRAEVTILPRGAALGVTEQLPEFERHLYPES